MERSPVNQRDGAMCEMASPYASRSFLLISGKKKKISNILFCYFCNKYNLLWENIGHKWRSQVTGHVKHNLYKFIQNNQDGIYKNTWNTWRDINNCMNIYILHLQLYAWIYTYMRATTWAHVDTHTHTHERTEKRAFACAQTHAYTHIETL